MTDYNLANPDPGITGPSRGGFNITPNDSADLPDIPRALYIEVGGTLKITNYDGTIETFAEVQPGLFQKSAKRVWSTGTTATGIHGWY